MKPIEKQAIQFHSEHVDLFARRYEIYEENPYRTTFTYGRMKIEQILERFMADRTGPQRILDVGCGTGFNLYRFSRAGHPCWGFDASFEMAQRARRNVPGCPIVLGEVRSLPFTNNFFDVVLVIEVVRYLSSPACAIAEFFRVLKPGGLCVVTAAPLFTSSGYGLFNRIATRLPGRAFAKVPQRFETTRSLRRLFEEAGFVETDVRACFLGPFIYIQRLMPNLLSSLLKRYEPWDDKLSHLPMLQELTNHLVIKGVKPRDASDAHRGNS